MPGGPQGGNATDFIWALHGGDMQENLSVEDTKISNKSVPQSKVYISYSRIH